jgi:hypothetical protein
VGRRRVEDDERARRDRTALAAPVELVALGGGHTEDVLADGVDGVTGGAPLHPDGALHLRGAPGHDLVDVVRHGNFVQAAAGGGPLRSGLMLTTTILSWVTAA